MPQTDPNAQAPSWRQQNVPTAPSTAEKSRAVSFFPHPAPRSAGSGRGDPRARRPPPVLYPRPEGEALRTKPGSPPAGDRSAPASSPTGGRRLPSPAGPPALHPPHRRHSNKETPNLRQRGWDNPEAWGRPAGKARQPGERVFPWDGPEGRRQPRLGPQAAGRRARRRGRGRPACPRARTGRSALGGRALETGHGATPHCRQQSPTETHGGAEPGPAAASAPARLSQAAQPEGSTGPDTIPACPAAWGICRVISPSSAALFPNPGPQCPL